MILASRATGSEGRPHHQFFRRTAEAARQKNRLPHARAAKAGFDPHRSVMADTVIFHINKEMTTMTNTLENHIEELRREANHCDPAERAQIEAELEQARAELAALIVAEDAEPPH